MSDPTHTAKLIKFPLRQPESQGWFCGCGSVTWILYANGDCLCVMCNCISTVIKVVRTDNEIPKENEGARERTNESDCD
jgi:hypothetical protein